MPTGYSVTVWLGPGVVFTQIGIGRFEVTIELEALRLHDLPKQASAPPAALHPDHDSQRWRISTACCSKIDGLSR